MAFKDKKTEEKLSWDQSIVLYLHDIIFAFIILVLAMLFVFRMFVVSGDSMNQTLVDGDYLLLLSNTFYRDPKPGDVVVISKKTFDDGSPIVKRIIAMEGQTVDIDFATGAVYVDGRELEEAYITGCTFSNGGMHFPLEVEEGCIFVMGDNRNVSRDSRYVEIGFIDTREVLGKAIFLMIPGTDHGHAPRDFGRIGVIQ